jgi:hypothetical protein
MRRLVEYPLDGGGTVLVEVDDLARGMGEQRGFSSERVIERTQQSFEDAIGRVQPAAQAIIHRLRAVADAPDEVKVEFGIELNAEVGAFLAGASSTGNFRVTMTWRSEPSHADADRDAGVQGG